MKLRTAAAAPFRGLKSLSRMVFARSSGLVFRFMPRRGINYRREVGEGMDSSLVMAPILWIARTFPEAPPQVLDEDGAPITPHAMVKLLRRPNRHYSGIVMWMATILSWVVDGNAYWLKVRNGLGEPVQLWYVPHWMIEPKSDSESDLVTHYEYRPDGKPITLEVEDVVHFRYGLDPDNPKRGLSPLASVIREVFTDDEASAFSASLLRNLGIPGLLISPKESANVNPGELKATKEKIQEETSGENRGKPLAMSGPTEVQTFGFSPEQLTLKDLRRIPEERVTAVLGTPAIVVGLGAGLDRSTFANYAEAREAAYEENIIPSQRMFGEDLRNQLLPDFEDNPDVLEVDFDRSGVRVLQEDRTKEAARVGQLWRDGLITRAAALSELGMESGDADEVYAIPFSVVLTPAGELPAPPPPPPALPPASDPGASDEDTESEAKIRGTKAATRQQQTLIVSLERMERTLSSVLAEELESDFDLLGDLAASAFESQAERVSLSARSNGHVKADDEQIVQSVVTQMALSEWVDGPLKSRLEAHWKRTADTTVETINTVLDVGVMLSEPQEAKLIRQGGTRRGLIDVADGTRSAIMRAIAAGRDEGEGPKAIARRIRDEVPAGRFSGAGPKYRSELIARTETKFAQNAASVEAYRAADTVEDLTVFDGRLATSDDDCIARDGEVVTFDEAEELMANEHPNGSLSFAPNVTEPDRVDTDDSPVVFEEPTYTSG